MTLKELLDCVQALSDKDVAFLSEHVRRGK